MTGTRLGNPNLTQYRIDKRGEDTTGGPGVGEPLHGSGVKEKTHFELKSPTKERNKD